MQFLFNIYLNIIIHITYRLRYTKFFKNNSKQNNNVLTHIYRGVIRSLIIFFFWPLQERINRKKKCKWYYHLKFDEWRDEWRTISFSKKQKQLRKFFLLRFKASLSLWCIKYWLHFFSPRVWKRMISYELGGWIIRMWHFGKINNFKSFTFLSLYLLFLISRFKYFFNL